MKKRILLLTVAIAAVAVGVVGMSAFEAHVINVTAKIENALNVPIEELDFGTVFPQQKYEQTFSVALSESFQAQAQCSDVNLIGNGGFEAPIVQAGAGWDIFKSEINGLVWTVEWVDPNASAPDPALQELHAGVNGWQPAAGDQYAELDSDYDGPEGSLSGEPALVRIYQNISTTPGSKYVLSYQFSPRPNTGAGDNVIYVKINGVQKDTYSAAGGANTSWTLRTVEFTADSSQTKVEFEGGGANNSEGVFLDDVKLVECGRVTSVNYVLRQKPKCWSEIDGDYSRVYEDEGGDFVCEQSATADDYEIMPLLCPYLSKSEETTDGLAGENDGNPILPFHGPIDVWTMEAVEDYETGGLLSAASEDLEDKWLIDLKVPCFEGHCAQDWAQFVAEYNAGAVAEDYIQPMANEHEIFGCDLWVEVIGINGITNNEAD